jgi:glycine/D-amino acid oxidase-like deaminating enzyme
MKLKMSYVEDLYSLDNKTAVVIGGGGVLAGCMAVGLAKAGANIAILDLNL